MALFRKPRIVGLVEVASRAELVRRKRQIRGVALRAALGAAAAVFALLMLLWLHSAAWTALAGPLGPVGGAAVVVAFDLLLCLGLGWFATRRRTDPAADEAIAVRNTALRGAQLELETLGGLLRGSEHDDGDVGFGKGRVRVYPP
jgi:hypothetical protein